MATYLEVVEAVGEYYGTGSDVWQKIATSGAANLTPEEIAAVRQVPGVSVTVTNSGRFVGWDFDNPFPSAKNPVTNVNSNVPNPSYGGGSSFSGRVNGTYHWNAETQTARLTSGARNVSTGARVATVAGKLNTAITAVSAGMFLGAKIDSALYNIGKFFDLNPPEELNPETWDNLATTEGGKQLIRHLFHIGDNGETTMYMPEDMIEYMYNYWRELGFWNSPGMTLNVDPETLDTLYYPNAYPSSFGIDTTLIAETPMSGDYVRLTSTFEFSTGTGYLTTFNNSYGGRQIIAVSQTSGTVLTVTNTYYRPDGSTRVTQFTYTLTSVSHSGERYYTYDQSASSADTVLSITPFDINGSNWNRWDIAQLIYKGTRVQNPTIDGVSHDPNASEQVNPSQIDPSQPILPQLKQQLPNTFNNPIKENVPQPDGTNKEIVYYPVPWPKITDDTDKPVTGDKNQDDPTVTPEDPSDETGPIKDVITNPNPQPTTPTPGDPATPPDTGSGSTPTVVPPTGQASSLWTVYNPTQAQLDAFGSWLWSSNFVDQIKKLFNDPMQAIIGVHKVFATPSTGSQVNIKCGYIDSGCPAAEVTSQYTTIDCGTVNVREYYGNVLDYSPYTEISLYLPFIGIVKLDVSDVMRGSVSVKYHVDVITGACLADVKINRDGESAVLYQYSGSAIVSYPISSGSYASMAAGVLSLAAGVAGTIMTGGAAAPALIGGALGLSHLHTEVQKSGGFSGAPGAMGGKKPYLIISRAQEALPSNFEKYEGKPASKTVTLGNCDGFIKVQAINIDDVPATYGELDQIVALLKQGVII